MTNEKTYILMDAQDPCDWEEVTIEEARQKIIGQWITWEELDDDGELQPQFTDEEIDEVYYFDLQQVSDALEGFDYILFDDLEERDEWLKEVGLL